MIYALVKKIVFTFKPVSGPMSSLDNQQKKNNSYFREISGTTKNKMLI